MFHGVDYGNMDPKGRLAIPARHREHLQERDKQSMVVTAHHQERCLVMRPKEVWQNLAKQIHSLPNASRDVQSFQRKLLGYAQEISVDSIGRILISPSLRTYAGLEKRIAIAGLGERLELWHASDWDEQIADSMNKVPDVIADLRL